MRTKFLFSLIPYVLLLPVLSAATPQPPDPLIPEEAPEALFSTQLGDAELDFFLYGTWQLSLTAGAGLVLPGAGGVRFLDTMPEITPGIIFRQLPDITFSLRLMQLYFLDFSYLGNTADNLFLAGYENPEGNGLKHLYLGNREVSIPPYRYLEIPGTGNASLGAQALLSTEKTEHNLLLRYDNNTRGSKMFIGANEVIEYTLNPADYIPDMFFRLPDAGVSDLTLYLEDAEGKLLGDDNRHYREAEAGEIVMDSVNGLIRLAQPPGGRVLVYYTKNGLPIGRDDISLGGDGLAGEAAGGFPDPENPVRFYFDMGVHLGTDMSERRITIGSRDCLLLGEAGAFSPFAFLNTYNLEGDLDLDRWQYQLNLIYRNSGKIKDDLPYPLPFQLLAEQKYLRIGRSLIPRDTLYNLYPLPDPENLLYGPGSVATPAYPEYEIRLQIFRPVSTYILEPGIVQGSVQVLRNGIRETAFTTDSESGVLTFRTEILPTDRLEITYKRKTESLNNGDILFAWGNRFTCGESGEMELGLGLRWNALSGAYSEEPLSRTGAVTGSWEYRIKRPTWDLTTFAGLSYSNPDTTGILHLAGMESTEIRPALEETGAYPASLPSTPTSPILTALNRGRLLYKDYHEELLLGDSYLHLPDWEGYKAVSYATGGKPGPYNVRGNSAGNDGQSLVLDFSMDSAPGWVGVQLPVPGGDLSEINNILLSCRMRALSGDCRLYLQLGATGEDLDGDGLLDAESGTESGGFRFNDPALPGELLVGASVSGTGNGVLDSEDTNGNNFPDPEIPAQLISLTDPALDFTSPGTDWTRIAFPLGQDQQARLKEVRSLRLLLVNTGGGGCTGILDVDAVRLQGTATLTRIPAGNGDGEMVNARHLPEIFLKDSPQTPLSATYPEVEKNFHKNGEPQQVLEVEWENLEPAESWELDHYLPAALSQLYYKTLVFYLRLPRLDTPETTELSIAILDYAGRGLHYTFTADPFTTWRECRLDLDSGKATLAGESLDGTLVTDTEHGPLTRLRLSGQGSAAGLLHLDEVHLRDTRGNLGAAIGAELNWERPGPLLTPGGFPLLGELLFKQQAVYESGGFSSLYGIPRENHSWHSNTTIGMDLLLTRLEFNLGLNNHEGVVNTQAGHRLQFPAGKSAIHIDDHFSYAATGWDTASPAATGMARANNLQFTFNTSNRLSLHTSAQQSTEYLKQDWSGELRSGTKHFFTNLFGLQLQTTANSRQSPPLPYPAAWLDAYHFLLPPGEADLQERLIKGKLEPVFRGENLELRLKAEISSRAGDFGEESGIRKHLYTYGFSLPWQVTPGNTSPWTITPAYTRTLRTTGTLAGKANFGGDWEGLWAGISTQPYFYTQWPLAELFLPGVAEKFNENNSPYPDSLYTPAFHLSLDRPPGSRLPDLILPASLELDLLRELRKEADTRTDINTYSISGRTNALNLFGKLGAYGLFSFYKIDEFTSQYSFKLTADETSLREFTYSLRHHCAFQGEEGRLLSLENLLQGAWEGVTDNLSTLTYSWNIQPEQGIDLPLLHRDWEKEGYITHAEGLKVFLRRNTSATPIHPFSLLINHSSSLQFPGQGHLTGELSLGFDYESPPRDTSFEGTWRLGIQAALEANFQL